MVRFVATTVVEAAALALFACCLLVWAYLGCYG